MNAMNKLGRVTILGAIVLVVAVLIQQEISTAEQVVQPEPVAATEEQLKEFEELLRVDERVTFQALVTGDITEFPKIYYDDPTVTLNSDYHVAIEKAGDRIQSALTLLEPTSIGNGQGYLSARTAIIINRQDNLAAWEKAQAEAAAENRIATLADMPNGEMPYEPKFEDQWVDVPFYVFDGKMWDDHATVKLTYEPPASAALISTYVFTQVDGRWYISGLESEYIANPSELPAGMETPTPDTDR